MLEQGSNEAYRDRKCNLLFHYRDAIKSHFTIFAIQNFVQNTKKHVDSIYVVGIMFVR